MSGVMQFNGILTTGSIVCKNMETNNAVVNEELTSKNLVTDSATVAQTLNSQNVNIQNLLEVNGYKVQNTGTSLDIIKDGELLLKLEKDE